MGSWNLVKHKKDTNYYGWLCPNCSIWINPNVYEVEKTVINDRLNKEIVVEAPAACISCGAMLLAPLTDEGIERLKGLVKAAKDIYGDKIPDIIRRWKFYYLDE